MDVGVAQWKPKTIDTTSWERIDLGSHFEVMFIDRLELFIPSKGCLESI